MVRLLTRDVKARTASLEEVGRRRGGARTAAAGLEKTGRRRRSWASRDDSFGVGAEGSTAHLVAVPA